MSYLISVVVVGDVVTEPVTLEDVKQHLNMQFDTDDNYEFTDDDAYLTATITDAREALERVTGYSLAPKTLTAVINNSDGNFDLPYGPVVSVEDVFDADGEVVDATIQGGVIVTCGAYQSVNYTAGYNTVPASMRRALLEEIAWLYNHRGDENDVTKQNRRLAKLNKKLTWLL